MKKRKKTLKSYTEPFPLFYLGFLASVGLALGSAMIINLLRKLIELIIKQEILIYSRIALLVFYFSFVIYSYRIVDMKRFGSLKNGFILFAIIYIIGQILVWI